MSTYLPNLLPCLDDSDINGLGVVEEKKKYDWLGETVHWLMYVHSRRGLWRQGMPMRLWHAAVVAVAAAAC